MTDREIIQLLIDLGYNVGDYLYDQKCNPDHEYSIQDKEEIACCISNAFSDGTLDPLWVSEETKDQLIIYINREYKALMIEF